jgi:hypothetical protein
MGEADTMLSLSQVYSDTIHPYVSLMKTNKKSSLESSHTFKKCNTHYKRHFNLTEALINRKSSLTNKQQSGACHSMASSN